MREKIVEAIRDEIGCGYNGELIDVAEGVDQILTLISEEIGKMENPYPPIYDPETYDVKAVFEECRQKILALLR